MTIAIPVDEGGKTVYVSFGRAPYFLFHDDGTGNTRVLANPAADAPGGAGVKAAQFVADAGADSLIAFRCGQNAAQVFSASNVAIYRAEGVSAEENLKALEAGRLPVLATFHAGFHGAV